MKVNHDPLACQAGSAPLPDISPKITPIRPPFSLDMLPRCSSTGSSIHPHEEINLKCIFPNNNVLNQLKNILFIGDTAGL